MHLRLKNLRDDGEDPALVVSTRRLVRCQPPALRAGESLPLFLLPEDHLSAPRGVETWWADEAPFKEAEAIGEVGGRARERGDALVGRWFELVLPLTAGGDETECRSRFSVDGFRVLRRSRA